MTTIELRGKVRDRDPETSWASAAGMDAGSLSALQEWVIESLREKPKSDEALVDAHREAFFYGRLTTRATPQRIRTSRKELELKLLVTADGLTKTRSGYKTQIWKTTA